MRRANDPFSALVLTGAQTDAIAAGAVTALPAEDCGLLTGVVADGVAVAIRLWPARNLAGDPRREFELDPSARIKAELWCRERMDERVIGHWHSHPNGRRDPSERDLAMAFEPGLIWLIAAVDETGAVHLAAFQPTPDAVRFRPVDIRVTETGAD